MDSGVPNTIAILNRGLYDHIASFPPARTELVDFWFKHAVESYVAAILSVEGQKLVISASNSADAASAIRRAALLADLVVVRVRSHIGRPVLSLLPLEDNLASPVLGAATEVDPSTGQHKFLSPVEYMYGNSLMILSQPESSAVVHLLGRPFDSQAEPSWERTVFSRTSQEFRNANGKKCHIVGGAIHVQIARDDTLLEDAQLLMCKGHITYAPFISLPELAGDITEGALKAAVMGGDLALWGGPIATKAASSFVLDLQVPYLEGIPLNLLSEVLDDEGESINAFRRALRRTIEDMEAAKDSDAAAARGLELKRGLLEDELDRVRRTCSRIARMNSVAHVGAYVGVCSLAVAAHFGLSPASAITGGAGVAAATLSALWRNHEETVDIRRSPMHFVWRLGQSAPDDRSR